LSRAPISLADRLRALADLRPADDKTTAAVLAMLTPRDGHAEVRAAARRAALPTHAAPSRAPTLPPPTPAAPAPPPAVRPVTQPPLAPASTRLHPVARRTWAALAAPPAAAVRTFAGHGASPVRVPPPLLPAAQQRAVLSTLAAVPAPGTTIDIDALVAALAGGRLVARLPRHRRWSLHRGAQLLLDCSPALLPLAHDVQALCARLGRVVGEGRLEPLSFAGCPTRGAGAGERGSWPAWRPPPAGVPVLVVSDLGCAGPRVNADWAGADEWSRFADVACAAAVPLVALVPYPVRRVPAALARRLAVVPWDEDLSAARVRRILRDARIVVPR